MTTNEFDKIPVGKRYTSKNSALTAMIPHLSNCDGLYLLLSGLYVSPFCLPVITLPLDQRQSKCKSPCPLAAWRYYRKFHLTWVIPQVHSWLETVNRESQLLLLKGCQFVNTWDKFPETAILNFHKRCVLIGVAKQDGKAEIRVPWLLLLPLCPVSEENNVWFQLYGTGPFEFTWEKYMVHILCCLWMMTLYI